MAGRIAKQKRMAKRKIEVLQSYLDGDKGLTPLLNDMGMRVVNEEVARFKLGQLSQRVSSL